ncbi:HpcH/HpaI aldolase/citrate lyase family protein [Asticcacaulis machinosus]|uniref:CoA ester lyase n=1 Tax=Asticcacaulis machinosus TaxID=2984211 RepID=A0ABT5HJT8_9CAUL|nr:CoA ester lyase [Asticcacaulis machinosus]MDC7676420.1 CoA ester lyase [Asticcacaulis machinosus]
MFRSVLFIPCGNPKALSKAHNLKADALIFDLEDAVGDTVKAAALEGLIETAGAGDFVTPYRMVRVNPETAEPDLKAFGDLFAAGRLHGIVIPKVASPQAIEDMAFMMPEVDLWAMIETPMGVVRLPDIARLKAKQPLKGFIAGPNDLRNGLRAGSTPQRAELSYALSQIVLYARAYGLIALDGVYNAFKDEDGFRAECMQGKALGFDGKTLIHPAQIEGCEVAFSPNADEIKWAQAVLAAYEQPENVSAGVVSVNGEMIERLHLKRAFEILNL